MYIVNAYSLINFNEMVHNWGSLKLSSFGVDINNDEKGTQGLKPRFKL